jgi:hypothetical protein
MCAWIESSSAAVEPPGGITIVSYSNSDVRSPAAEASLGGTFSKTKLKPAFAMSSGLMPGGRL